MFFDLIRILDFGMFGVGCAFMLVTNVLAYKVLRPYKKPGFLWWHVTSISISFLCLGSVAVSVAYAYLGQGPTWRTPTIFVGFLTFMIAQGIIFSVESQRYVARQAADKTHVGDVL